MDIMLEIRTFELLQFVGIYGYFSCPPLRSWGDANATRERLGVPRTDNGAFGTERR